MYLKKLWVKNFRCIKDATIDLNEGVNVLIGENNSGKTAILDALRICLSYGKQWRDIYVSSSDFHIDKSDPETKIGDIEFHLYFEVQREEEAGIYNDLLSAVDDKGKRELQLHFRYFIEERKGIRRVKYRVWGGDKEGQSITPEVLDLIYFIHLDALRDAVQHLRPVRGNRLGELYAQIVTDGEKQDTLAKKVRSTLGEDTDWTDLIKQGKEKVNEHLKETTIRGKEQTVEIDFLPFEFRRIVDNLRVQTPVYSDTVLENKERQRYFELYQNGLGYNNLIFIATVLGDLKRRKELYGDAYVSLLIENFVERHGFIEVRKDVMRLVSLLPKTDCSIGVWVGTANETLKQEHIGIEFKIKVSHGHLLLHDLFARDKKQTTEYRLGTIHSVKGETFGGVLVILKKKGLGAYYKTLLQQKVSIQDSEELRIVYVGITRPRKLLMLAVPDLENKSVWENKLISDTWKT